MTERVQAIEKFLRENFDEEYGIQTFFSRNLVGDEMETIYEENGVTIDYCSYWDYIEVFGLSEEEEKELMDTDMCHDI